MINIVTGVQSTKMGSKEITKVYNEAIREEGKPEKRHCDVLDSIRNMLKELNYGDYRRPMNTLYVIGITRPRLPSCKIKRL